MEKKSSWGCLVWLIAPLGVFLFFYLQFGDAEIAWLMTLGTALLLFVVWMVIAFFNAFTSQGGAPSSNSADDTPLAQLAREAASQPQTPIGRIDAMIADLKDPAVQKEARDCAVLCREILAAAEQNEAVRGKLENFHRHYLPMFEQMLENYAKCEAADVLPPSLAQKLTEFLDTMESAMKKLKENVYTSDVARLSVDMDVLETLYRTDGLLDDGLRAAQEQDGSRS